MRTVALISGGKDSCFNMMCCEAEGHEIVALANLRPQGVDEMDSYMYQTVGHHAIDLYAEAMDLPLYVQTITGSSLSTGSDYTPHEGDEVEDLYTLLCKIKESERIEAVSVGAILSDYQRVRVENVCQRLGLVVLSFLWRRNQEELLKEMIDCGLRAIIIKVAALGLSPNKHLGMELSDIYPHMLKMRQAYGLNECGEGGEYETFVIDCPIFKKSIVINETEKVIHSDDAFAPVGYLNLKNCCLKEKEWNDEISRKEKVLQRPLSTSDTWFKQKMDAVHCIFDGKSQDEQTASDKDINSSQHSSQICSGNSHTLYQTDGINFKVSGVAPLYSEGNDVKDVTKKAMDTLIACVTEMGHKASEIFSVSLYVRDLSHFADINSVYKTFFDINPPVRLCIEACLPGNVLLQLDCQGRKLLKPEERKTMHVQALSHWAPANIGPYSQATQLDEVLYLAGIVPLCPSTLNVIDGDIRVQCCVALTHVQEVVKAMCPHMELSDCRMVTCFVTYTEHIQIAKETWKKFSESECVNLQCCVVPALPKGCLVEWQIKAWKQPSFEKFTKNFPKWNVEVQCQYNVENEQKLSCHLCLDMSQEVTESQLHSSDVESIVKDLLECYTLTKNLYASTHSQPLAKVFYNSSAFDFDRLHTCFNDTLCTLIPETSKRPVISLIPVINLESKADHDRSQLIVWCQ